MEDSVASCPFCHLSVLVSELQRHANAHFEDDDDINNRNHENEQITRDLELAQQLALTPCSTSSNTHQGSMADKMSCLVAMQTRSSFYHVSVNGGLMALLRKCLELDLVDNYSTTTVLLSGYIDHFQSMSSEDVGWGCGWRNIQMFSSHLLYHRQESREVLFGGCGFVPDIPYLQRWLEIAWEKGFDALGSHHFNRSIYGFKHWIGTTECAALFRSFGLRARIVDFGPNESESLFLSVPGTSLGSHSKKPNDTDKKKASQVYGPMDRYLLGRHCDVSQPDSIAHDNTQCCTIHLDAGSNHTRTNKIFSKNKDHQALLVWVWKYFSKESLDAIANNQHVIVTDRTPLYFQHDGHSRTIVGIELRHQQNGMPQYNLLILDPAHRTAALDRSLEENVGWKKLIKRGVHTLRKPQYQLCYIDPGIASEEEMERLKTIDSVFIEL